MLHTKKRWEKQIQCEIMAPLIQQHIYRLKILICCLSSHTVKELLLPVLSGFVVGKPVKWSTEFDWVFLVNKNTLTHKAKTLAVYWRFEAKVMPSATLHCLRVQKQIHRDGEQLNSIHYFNTALLLNKASCDGLETVVSIEKHGCWHSSRGQQVWISSAIKM